MDKAAPPPIPPPNRVIVPSLSVIQVKKEPSLPRPKKNSARKNRKALLKKSKDTIAEVTEYLFVSGREPASSRDMLKAYGITHVVNCTARTCESFFEDSLTYLNMYLDDTPKSDIDLLLYEVVDFVRQARSKCGKVLIHCEAGVSRSCSFVMGVLIASHEMSFKRAFDRVTLVRRVCNPNAGFCSQLIAFAQRFRSITAVSRPRLYVVTSIQKFSGRPVARTCLYGNMKCPRVMDSRHCYLLVAPDRGCGFFWIGDTSIASESCQKRSKDALEPVVSTLIRIDSRGKHLGLGDDGLVVISEGDSSSSSSSSSFLEILRECGYVTKTSQHNFTSSFVLSPRSCTSNSEDEGNLSARHTRVRLEDIVGTSCLQSPRVSVAGSSVSSSRRNERPKLYQWEAENNKWESLYSYEDDDLSSNGLFILDGEKSTYIWCGKHFPIRDREKLQSIVSTFSSSSSCSSSSGSTSSSSSSIPPPPIFFVDETKEPDEFWELFEDGF